MKPFHRGDAENAEAGSTTETPKSQTFGPGFSVTSVYLS